MNSNANERELTGIILSTRPVDFPEDGHSVCFTRDALEGVAAQINERQIPLNREHLRFVPPLGHVTSAQVEEAEDGEFELHVKGTYVTQTVEERDLDLSLSSDGLLNAADVQLQINVEFTPRNFDPDVATEIADHLGDKARQNERWAELPPLEFALVVPMLWGAVRFAGAFFDALGQAAGQSLASKVASWCRRSRQPERVPVIAIYFEMPNGRFVSGYSISSGRDAESAVSQLLQHAECLAEIAGFLSQSQILPGMRDAAFFLQDGEWQLGWWNDDRNVYETSWFRGNRPDLSQFLDGPE
ncbi:hypothetical protein [Candidatus Poriferisodalis sp.]|uniref:hypothetical protein n=1 Tax=Candidatus Poriferisodalis sp. TaxID=3101277 RepID=UPI003AF8611B